MKLIPDFLRNHEFIVDYCNTEGKDKFIPRRKDPSGGHTGLVNASSTFSSFKMRDMDDWFIDKIFENSDFDEDLKEFCMDIQIQRYFPGEYIVPHKDNYETPKIHLVTLTTSKYDGIVLIKDRTIIKVPDLGGQKIDYDFNSPHWVDPVMDLRYSLVIVE